MDFSTVSMITNKALSLKVLLDLVRKRNELWSMSNLGPHHINEDCLHLELDFPSQTNSWLSKKIQRAQEI